jgi:caa(3)-type oxidase subunit IV
VSEYLRNPLTRVWAFLAAITILAWWLGRGHGLEYQSDAAITVGVLAIASVKALLVIAWFMEVRSGPVWLKLATYGWVVGLLSLLLTTYFLSM